MYAITKIRTFQGREGYGLNATITRDGKPIAFVLDDANGGEMRIDFRNPGQTPKSFHGTTTQSATEAEKVFFDFARQWWNTAPEAQAVREQHADLLRKYPNSGRGEPTGFGCACDWINTMVDHARFVKMAQKKTLFRLKDDQPGTWRALSGGAYNAEAQKYLDQKFPGKVAEIFGVTRTVAP